ncbi:hypothetical protein [Microtetraspora sp. AC03309]|uniref:hypothetical protein n=1 Tax=Microtetraspora sp. AC03309 TaxID=2779376 RepID=UPI001E2F51C8|nr:hypothetical protein [Microtetraspora sp. AC03309]
MTEPGHRTPMQKVIPPRLLVPYLSGKRTIISGYVYRVRDCGRLTTPAALVGALDLGFEGSDLVPGVPELYIMRWQARDTDSYVVPYGPHMGGDWNDAPPFTGNGFTASRDSVVPQLHTMPMPIPAGAEIIHLTKAGERAFAHYDGLSWRPAS